jgi:hypothetical protein
VNPVARISASLTLTLIVWGPNALVDWQSGPDALPHILLRFLVIFTMTRVAMRGIESLLQSYIRATRRDQRPIDAEVATSSTVHSDAPTRKL